MYVCTYTHTHTNIYIYIHIPLSPALPLVCWYGSGVEVVAARLLQNASDCHRKRCARAPRRRVLARQTRQPGPEGKCIASPSFTVK